MNIVRAQHAGACFGVQRALRLLATLDEDAQPAATLGPIIHNPRVVSELERKGIHAIEESELKNLDNTATLVLRTHGVSPRLLEQVSTRKIVDATCPFVQKAHRVARELENQGCTVVILGQAGHPEVEGIQGEVNNALIIESAKDVRSYSAQVSGRKVGVMAQTTQPQQVFIELCEALKPYASELIIKNTICEATAQRQASATQLARSVDAMLVIGGKNSANTAQLAHLCKRYCPVYLIEGIEDIDINVLRSVSSLGVTAGASTPIQHIDEVISYLEDIS